jgi:hypothetical protein
LVWATPGVFIARAISTVVVNASLTSISPAGDAIVVVEYSINGGPNVTLASNTGKSSVEFRFNATVTSVCDTITAYAEDTLGNWASSGGMYLVLFSGGAYSVTEESPPTEIRLMQNGPLAINFTVTNDLCNLGWTVIVKASVLNSKGTVVSEPTATIIFSNTERVSNASTYPLLVGLPHGNYRVQLDVYSTSWVSLSPEYYMNVTV